MAPKTQDDHGVPPNAIRILKARFYVKDDKGDSWINPRLTSSGASPGPKRARLFLAP